MICVYFTSGLRCLGDLAVLLAVFLAGETVGAGAELELDSSALAALFFGLLLGEVVGDHAPSCFLGDLGEVGAEPLALAGLVPFWVESVFGEAVELVFSGMGASSSMEEVLDCFFFFLRSAEGDDGVEPL